MRLYLLPISTRRTLLYCERFNVQSAQKKTLVDNVTTRAATLWSKWEKKESGWQRKIVDYGNHALRRIPYEEWGLKSVPPLSARRRDEELKGQEKVELVFPDTVIPTSRAVSVLKTLGTERESFHKRNLTWCLVGMPFTIPFALVPGQYRRSAWVDGAGEKLDRRKPRLTSAPYINSDTEPSLLLSRLPCVVALACHGRRKAYTIPVIE